MTQRFFAWLTRQLWPHLEPQIRAEALRLVVERWRQHEQELTAKQAAALHAAQPPRRRFIGQP